MVRPIMRDMMFLSRKSTPATKADLPVAQDLTDTLRAHSHECVGMAANMIGVSKRIIVVSVGVTNVVMINPVITAHSKEQYETEEGCLSLTGVRKTKRYESVTVEYCDMQMIKRRGTFTGFTAQIIQHELDHCNGIII